MIIKHESCPNGHGPLDIVENGDKEVRSCRVCVFSASYPIRHKRQRFNEKVKKAIEGATERILMEIMENRLTEGYVPVWKTERWHKVLKANYNTMRPYNGMNRLFLYNDDEDLYLTKKQIEKMELTLHRGKNWYDDARTVLCWFPIFNKKDSDEEEEEEKEERPVRFAMKVHEIYQAKDVDGLPEKKRPDVNENKKDKNAEAFVARLKKSKGLKLSFGGNNAGYSFKSDTVILPKVEHFASSELYYASLFHEIAHWTGHPKRLKRFETTIEREEEFGRENLAAEMASAALCHHFGINVVADNAAYIDSWINTLRGDLTLLAEAAEKSEKILKMLLE